MSVVVLNSGKEIVVDYDYGSVVIVDRTMINASVTL